MPPRLARSSVRTTAPKTARNKSRKRNLEAYSIASHSTPQNPRIKPSRLGETLDDGPKQKRRRIVEDEDGNEESAEEEVPGPRQKQAGPEDDDVEEGSDSSGNEWTLGGLREDDSDSDLDSDEAFGESDEERFEGFAFRGSRSGPNMKIAANKSQARRLKEGKQESNGDVDLDENDSGEEDEDDFGDEGMDLATMLDDDEDDELLGGKDNTRENIGEESASDDDDDDDSASQASSGHESEDDGNEEERIARMRDRLEAMDANQPATSKPSTSTPYQPATLTVDDLLADLDPVQKKQFHAAIKTRKKSERPTTLTAPLPKRQQDKLNREIASEKAKEQLERWRDTVIRNRRAEFLSFPLEDPDRVVPVGKDRFIVDDSVPHNELETNIRRIMVESGLAGNEKAGGDDEEAGLLKAEELATNKLPVEEVMRRRAELRQARELLFREEIKAKRIKKIKSKSYRRVHRNERKRMAISDRELMAEEELEDEQERVDRKRAEARMSTKHRDSKFAKALKATNRTVWDEGARYAVNDEARRKEELRRRIAGDEVEGEEDSDISSDDADGEGFASNEEGMQTLGQLDKLYQRANGDDEKGLRGMKFMRAADERQWAQNDEDIERMRRELAIEDGDEQSEDDQIDDQGLGRAFFGPKGQEKQAAVKKARKPEMEEGDVSENDGDADDAVEVDIVTEKAERANGAEKSKKTTATLDNILERARAMGDRRGIGAEPPNEGSWLDRKAVKERKKGGIGGGRRSVDIITTVGNADPKPFAGHEPVSQKEARKVAKAIRSGAQDTVTDNTDGWTTVTYKGGGEDTDSDGEGSDAEPADPLLSAKEQKKARYDRAFAADNVKLVFDAEKADLAVSEDEKEESNYLPGWGSWTGEGLSKSIKKSNAKQKHNPLFKTKTSGVKAADRKDAKLENVIVSEKQQRKGKHYMAPILPHGFETKTQYERSLRLPVGPEWTTKEVFQRSTRPRVVVKPGTVIEAMERPLI